MRTCAQCNAEFHIIDRDREFYAKLDLPEPTLCPDCSRQRRASWRNERKLYRRNCDLCKKSIISCISSDKPLTVYCNPCWHSDQFDPLKHGRDFDFSRPFFEQFSELERSVPHFALFQEGGSENSEYCNYGSEIKSCYMSLAAFSENVYYSYFSIKTRDSMDVTKTMECEQCYECVDAHQCTRLFFSHNCYQCHESSFLINCTNCKNCFGSINLHQKQYVFLNQQLTKEDYEKKMKAMRLDNQKIQDMHEFMRQLSRQSIHRSSLGGNNEDVSGNYIDHCKNCHHCFDVLMLENAAYCDGAGWNAHDLWSCSNGGISSTLVYESNGFATFNRVAFHLYGRNVQDSFYNQCCFNSHHLFGCFGVNHGEHMILNKKYSQDEYEKLMPKIIEHMRKTREWGEFFPIRYSPYGYNETVAQDHFSRSREEVLARGWPWYDRENKIVKQQETDTVKTCQQCQKSFLIIEREKQFYEKFYLPTPIACPDCRHRRRFLLRNPHKLWSRQCAKCQKPIQTSYAPDRPETVYCEECYLKEIY